jgi:hypothetical protein
LGYYFISVRRRSSIASLLETKRRLVSTTKTKSEGGSSGCSGFGGSRKTGTALIEEIGLDPPDLHQPFVLVAIVVRHRRCRARH